MTGTIEMLQQPEAIDITVKVGHEPSQLMVRRSSSITAYRQSSATPTQCIRPEILRSLQFYARAETYADNSITPVCNFC